MGSVVNNDNFFKSVNVLIYINVFFLKAYDTRMKCRLILHMPCSV